MQALQHRGQTGAGMAVFNGADLHIEKNSGLVTEALKDENLRVLMYQATGPALIGHDRYSTSGKTSSKENARLAQPFPAPSGRFALGHNGHMEGIGETAKRLGFDVSDCESDSESLTHLLDEMYQERGDLVEAIHVLLPTLEGAFNLVINEPNRLIGVRDPRGYRPLSIGKLPNGGTMLASETIAFDVVGAEFIRDVEPGEIIIVEQDGLRSEKLSAEPQESFCMFEYIYFSHPNSLLLGRNVYKVREQLGRLLGADHPVEADMVVGVQNSGALYARGYSHQTGIPEELAITKNPYINRTFIEGNQMTRVQSVRLKHQPNRSMIDGKRIVLVDDSIVRGTTTKQLVSSVRDMGAAEVHVRIPSPPYAWPCYFGMDTHDVGQLIAHKKSIEEIREYIGADSLEFLSLERVIEGIESQNDKSEQHIGALCMSCMTGIYPTEVPVTLSKDSRAKVLASK